MRKLTHARPPLTAQPAQGEEGRFRRVDCNSWRQGLPRTSRSKSASLQRGPQAASTPFWGLQGLTDFLPLSWDPQQWACPASLLPASMGLITGLLCLQHAPCLPLQALCLMACGTYPVLSDSSGPVILSASLGLPIPACCCPSPTAPPLPFGHHLSISGRLPLGTLPAVHLGSEMASLRGCAVWTVGLRLGPAGAPGGTGEAASGRGCPEGDPPQ